MGTLDTDSNASTFGAADFIEGITRLAEAQARLDKMILVDNPDRAVRKAVADRCKELNITDPMMVMDLIGNGLMDIEHAAYLYLNTDRHTDQSFQQTIEEFHQRALQEKLDIFKRRPVREQEPDDRFPRGMIDYYTTHCSHNRFAAHPFVSEDGMLTVSAPDVHKAIIADIRMVACKAALQEIGITESPLVKKNGRIPGK